ncbi:MAG: sporulation protein YabP [Firmicutes bacterium]|nr:sporulation protein YabP [Bacillota bacterium]
MSEGHEIVLSNRQRLVLTGVLHVESFDEDEIILETNMGMLALKGQGLHVLQLNLEDGKLAVEGAIKTLDYLDERAGKHGKGRGRGFWQRLLK